MSSGLNAEPICCGAPMVHNSWLGQYECADAYFALLDDEVIADTGVSLRVEHDELTEYQRERWKHWRASWIPDDRSGEWRVRHPGIGVLTYPDETSARAAAGTAGVVYPPGESHRSQP